MLSLELKNEENIVLLNKVEIEKEIKSASDVLALVVVEENGVNNEPPFIIQPVLNEFILTWC